MPKPLLAGTIYDEPQIFGDDSPGDYNDLYSRQLTKLVDMILPDGSPVSLFEVWLDSASGSSTVQTFDWTGFRDIIRTHQPGAIMWGHQGVDARWVGNEDGVTGPTNWHTISRTQDQARLSEAERQTGLRDGLYWTPAEADARVRDGWFWHADERPTTSQQLPNMYRQSVGRIVNLLLDVPPDTTGKITTEDDDALMDFKRLRDAFLSRSPVTSDSNITASSVRGDEESAFGPANVLDGLTDTYWTMDDAERTGWVDIDLGGRARVDAFIVQEHIALGQRVGGYVIDILQADGAFETVINGTSLGYMRIDRLDVAIETTRVRFRVTQANAVPLIQSIQVLGTKAL